MCTHMHIYKYVLSPYLDWRIYLNTPPGVLIQADLILLFEEKFASQLGRLN